MLRVKCYVRVRVPRLRLNIVLKQVCFNQRKGRAGIGRRIYNRSS